MSKLLNAYAIQAKSEFLIGDSIIKLLLIKLLLCNDADWDFD
jgi:hypothetical protein